MAGIIGIFEFSKLHKIDNNIANEMLKATSSIADCRQLKFIDDYIFLGEKRQNSLVDEKHISQNEYGDIYAVIYGILYNCPELRMLLSEKCHIFNSDDDAETIVHLYEEFGDRFIGKLEGEFVGVLWDAKKSRLLIFGDHCGSKAVYYSIIGGAIVFGSQINPILKYPGIKTAPSLKSVISYLSLSFVPPPNTMFEQIKTMPMGKYLSVNKNGIKTNDHYLEKDKAEIYGNLNVEHTFETLIKNAIKKAVFRLPKSKLCIFLSGGMDSTYIAAACQNLGITPTAYHVNFPEDKSAAKAEEIASTLGLEYENIEVSDDILYSYPSHIKKVGVPPENLLADIFGASFQDKVKKSKFALTGLFAEETLLSWNYGIYKFFPYLRNRFLRSIVNSHRLDMLPDYVEKFIFLAGSESLAEAVFRITLRPYWHVNISASKLLRPLNQNLAAAYNASSISRQINIYTTVRCMQNSITANSHLLLCPYLDSQVINSTEKILVPKYIFGNKPILKALLKKNKITNMHRDSPEAVKAFYSRNKQLIAERAEGIVKRDYPDYIKKAFLKAYKLNSLNSKYDFFKLEILGRFFSLETWNKILSDN
ncbi:MAG: hypothetical protein HY051_05345 [Candidatus Aenigmarchaeota archaeon]|nr:hypothetical protein [Candidatus Aenigmarchaeota archaeon]